MKKVSVECRGISVSYGSQPVLRSLNLRIEPGEFFALLGPSGSGKSTLLRLIAGFNNAEHGQLLVDGRDISGLPAWQRPVGMVFQNYALWPHLSVWDNVAFGLVERRTSANEVRRKVTQALELVDLAPYGQRKPHQLSGGQQQRVALARTLVIEPQVLLLDEPLSNLDKSLRVQMRQELWDMQRRLGLTTVFVTHDQEEAMTTADRMAVLDQGVMQQVGSPRDLYDEPVNAFVARFVGTATLWPATISRVQANPTGDVEVNVHIDGVGELSLPGAAWASAGTPAWLSFRPHALQWSTHDSAPPADAARLTALQGKAQIESSEFCGEFTRHRLRWGPHTLLADRTHARGQQPLQVGQWVELTLPRSAVGLLPR